MTNSNPNSPTYKSYRDDKPILLTAAEFAEGMPFSKGTLDNSRLTGRLMGVDAPKHIRFGRFVRYPKSERDKWLRQFEMVQTASEYFANRSNRQS